MSHRGTEWLDYKFLLRNNSPISLFQAECSFIAHKESGKKLRRWYSRDHAHSINWGARRKCSSTCWKSCQILKFATSHYEEGQKYQQSQQLHSFTKFSQYSYIRKTSCDYKSIWQRKFLDRRRHFNLSQLNTGLSKGQRIWKVTAFWEVICSIFYL